jgi:hypothetical protein
MGDDGGYDWRDRGGDWEGIGRTLTGVSPTGTPCGGTKDRVRRCGGMAEASSWAETTLSV